MYATVHGVQRVVHHLQTDEQQHCAGLSIINYLSPHIFQKQETMFPKIIF